MVTNDNAEIMSAHLACFAFSNVADGAALIRTACEQVASLNYPALFVSVAAADVPSLSAALGKIKVVYAPATIFAQGIATGSDWNINCSEI